MERLFKGGFLNNVKARYRSQQSIMREDFKVNSNIQEAILLKKDIRSVSEIKIYNDVDFVDYVFSLMKHVKDEELVFSDVLKNVKLTIKKNRHIDFADILLKHKLSVEDIYILLFYIDSYRAGDKDLSIDMYGENSTSSNLMQYMAAGRHKLVKRQFLRNMQSRSSRHDEFDFELTGESKNLMREDQNMVYDFLSAFPQFTITLTIQRFNCIKHSDMF